MTWRIAADTSHHKSMAQAQRDNKIRDSLHLWIQSDLSSKDRRPWLGTCSRYNLQTQVRTTVKQKEKQMPVEFYLHLGRSTNRIRVINSHHRGTLHSIGKIHKGIRVTNSHPRRRRSHGRWRMNRWKRPGPTEGDGAWANLGVAEYMFIQ